MPSSFVTEESAQARDHRDVTPQPRFGWHEGFLPARILVIESLTCVFCPLGSLRVLHLRALCQASGFGGTPAGQGAGGFGAFPGPTPHSSFGAGGFQGASLSGGVQQGPFGVAPPFGGGTMGGVGGGGGVSGDESARMLQFLNTVSEILLLLARAGC